MAKDPNTISEESIRDQRPDLKDRDEAETETEPTPADAADLAEAADRKARLDTTETAQPKPVASKKK